MWLQLCQGLQNVAPQGATQCLVNLPRLHCQNVDLGHGVSSKSWYEIAGEFKLNVG